MACCRSMEWKSLLLALRYNETIVNLTRLHDPSALKRDICWKNELCSTRALQTTFHPLGHKKTSSKNVMWWESHAKLAGLAQKNLVKIFRIARRDEESRGEWTTEKNSQSGWYCSPATQSKNGKVRCRREAKRVPDYARSKIVVEGHEFASVERSTGIVGESFFFRVFTRHELDFFSFFCKCGREFRKLSSSSSRSLLVFCEFWKFAFHSSLWSSLLDGFLLLQQCYLLSRRLLRLLVCMNIANLQIKWNEQKNKKFISGRSSPFHTRVPFFFRACCCAAPMNHNIMQVSLAFGY